MNEADKKRLEEMQIEARTVPLSEKERWLIGQLEAAEATCQSLIDQSSRWEAQALEAWQEIERLKLEHDYEITVLDDARKAAESDAAQHQAVFDMQQKRMGAATVLWREATGKHDVLPDLGDLLDWLMSEAARQRNRRVPDPLLGLLREARDALKDFGRHNQGCSGDFPPHKCTCGWDRDAMPLFLLLDAHLSRAEELQIVASEAIPKGTAMLVVPNKDGSRLEVKARIVNLSQAGGGQGEREKR